MPVTCIVFNCGSRADRDHSLSFFRIPTIKNSIHYPHINELSKKRRDMWIAAFKRKDLTETILRNQRVCSLHFITGKPALLQEENHQDWVPSQKMGFSSLPVKRKSSDIDMQQRENKKLRTQFRFVEVKQESEIFKEMENGTDKEQATSIATQTELTMEELEIKSEQLSCASKKIEELEKKVEMLLQK